MHAKRKEATQDVPTVPAMDGDNQAGRALLEFVKSFTRPVRRPATPTNHYLLDSFDREFCIVFDFSPDPETPESVGTCDVNIVPLPTEDVLADSIRFVSNAKRHDVMRVLAAIGIQRFDDKVKTAYYALSNPLR